MQRRCCVFSGKIHLAVAVFIWLVSLHQGKDLHAIGLIVGALWADTDTKKSLLGRLVPLWLIFKHRGFTHKLKGMFFFSLVCYFIFGKYVATGFFVGYLSHLVMDTITPKGVKWF